MLRRVEPKNRAVAAGATPWSIRQTAIYQRLELDDKKRKYLAPNGTNTVPAKCRSTVLLVSPAENVELQFADHLGESSPSNKSPAFLWNTHRILITDSLRGWMDYMAYLEQRLKHQVNLTT
jgi:hypothetical protein